MAREADHAINVMREAWKFGRTLEGVHISAVDGHIYVTVDGTSKASDERVRAAKKRLGDYLMGVFPSRKFLHAKTRGYTVWRWNYNPLASRSDGFRAGINLKLTPEEESELLRGEWASRQQWGRGQ